MGITPYELSLTIIDKSFINITGANRVRVIIESHCNENLLNITYVGS